MTVDEGTPGAAYRQHHGRGMPGEAGTKDPIGLHFLITPIPRVLSSSLAPISETRVHSWSITLFPGFRLPHPRVCDGAVLTVRTCVE